MTMINLKQAQKEKDSGSLCCPEYEAPAYPYGLSISLCDESLEKLGMSDLPKVGTVKTFTVQATVTSVSQNETAKPDDEGSTQNRNVSLQITDIDMGQGGATSMADRMYGK